MAKIKGWKKDNSNNSNYGILWINSNNKNIGIFVLDLTPISNGWVVEKLLLNQHLLERKTIKDGMTKQEAVDYAIKYMRANPNG